MVNITFLKKVHDSMSGGLKGLKSELDSRASEGGTIKINR